jgi:hypothetical protein
MVVKARIPTIHTAFHSFEGTNDVMRRRRRYRLYNIYNKYFMMYGPPYL